MRYLDALPLPSSPEAEMGILGSILIDRECMSECSAKLTLEHFHHPVHRMVYEVLQGLWKENKPMDFIALTQALKDRDRLEAAGGAYYVTELFTYVPTAANLAHYIAIASEKEHLRRIIVAANTAIAGAHASGDPEELVRKLCAEIPSRVVTGECPTFRELLDRKLERMEKDEPDAGFVATGLKKLDFHSPLRGSGLVLITGPKKSGKSILSLTIASNVADPGHGVAYYSLEDRSDKVLDRMFARKARIPIVKQHGMLMNEGEFRRVTNAYTAMAEWGFYLRDDIFDCFAIVSDLRRLKATNPNLKLAVVDYLQLVRGERQKGSNREQEVAGVGREFSLLRMELGIDIILLSQENSDGNTRESLATEQHCTACWKIVLPDEDEDQKQRKIKIPYQRNGEGNIFFRTAFLGEFASFEDYCGAEEPL